MRIDFLVIVFKHVSSKNFLMVPYVHFNKYVCSMIFPLFKTIKAWYIWKNNNMFNDIRLSVGMRLLMYAPNLFNGRPCVSEQEWWDNPVPQRNDTVCFLNSWILFFYNLLLVSGCLRWFGTLYDNDRGFTQGVEPTIVKKGTWILWDMRVYIINVAEIKRHISYDSRQFYVLLLIILVRYE